MQREEALPRSKRREMALDLMALPVGTKQIAEQHDTSPYVVQQAYEQASLTEDEAERYAENRYGGRRLHPKEVRDAYRDGQDYKEIAAEKDLRKRDVQDCLRGRASFDYLEDIVGEPLHRNLGGRLGEERAREIRARYKEEDISYIQIAREEDVAHSTVSHMVRGENAYSHLKSLADEDQGKTSRAVSDETVDQIRRAHAEGALQADLADEHGVSPTTIHHIVRRKGPYSNVGAGHDDHQDARQDEGPDDES
jgi:transposase-like protein